LIQSAGWSGNNDIFATDLSGTVRRVTGCDEFCFTPAWSPNGEHIAFSIERPTSKDSPAADHHVRPSLASIFRDKTTI
jgi:Tol biopolymer transport system component